MPNLVLLRELVVFVNPLLGNMLRVTATGSGLDVFSVRISQTRGQEHSPRPGRGSQTSQTSQTLQTLQLQSIAENVAGMRQDTRQLLAGAFRAELDGFG